MKNFKRVLVLLIVLVLGISVFAGCSKTNKNQTQETFKGVKVYMFNDIVSTQEVALSDSVKTLTYTYDEVKNVEEGLISLLELRGMSYNQHSVNLYDKLGEVELGFFESNDGVRIVVFTSKDSDKSTTDTAKTIRIDGQVLTQTNKDVDELTFEEGTYILITKVQL